jgi:hypothetical protein
MRAVILRYAAVLGLGLVALAGILYYASSVDGRPPSVEAFRLTLHASDDERLALTTSGIEVEFSEAVRTQTAEDAFRIAPDVAGEFSWSGPVLRFTPEERLPLETDFAVHLEAGVEDEAGNRMTDATAAFEFRTVGPPGVASTDPVDGADDVPLDDAIVIGFNTLMDTASVEDALEISPVLGYEVSWSAEQLTIVPSTGLREGTTYRVTIGTDARDSAGIPLAQPFSFEFDTAGAPIEVTQLVPADGVEGLSPVSPIAVFFDRELDPDADLDELFSIEPEVAGTLEVVVPPGAAGLQEPVARLLRFQPSGALASNTTYRVTLAAGLAAADGSRLGDEIEWTFTTGSPLGTLSNQVVFLSDRSGVANLWAMNPDGSGQRQVSAELSAVVDYAVAPDARRVVVGDGATLVLQRADGSGRTLLTPSDALEFDPAWAPDGSRFAFGRAELTTGSGAGLWTRAADGGDEQQLEVPDVSSPSPSPSGTPGDEVPVPILRAPRYAPDGSALAFVDTAGSVRILDLDDGTQRAAFVLGVSAPAWLPDSSGVLVSVLPGGAPKVSAPGSALPPLLAEEPYLNSGEIARLEIVRVDSAASRLVHLDLPPGAHQPEVIADLLLYLLDGAVYLTDDPRSPEAGRRLLPEEPAEIGGAIFGVEERTVLLAENGGGVSLLDALTGRLTELSADGSRPRWLP